MQISRKLYNLILLVVLASLGCKKPYTPQVITNAPSYLVVEGTILSGDSTIFKLSRTVNISTGTTTNPVSGAKVSFETSSFNIPLSEQKPGYYASPPNTLDPAQQYRLRIALANGTTYLSDYVPLKATPPIDSIGFSTQNDGIQLYVNTHDPNNATKYYRWSYDETWKFHALYNSEYVTDGTQIVPRNANQSVYYCFASNFSSTIFLGSSAKLAQDVIYQSPLGFIPSTSEKIETRYSILLRQYALTSDAFTFWTNLKKNTEQLGSIFDAQPSQINGNIHNIKNPVEPVFGYISACTVSTKRIFIDNTVLNQNWKPVYPYICGIDSLFFSRLSGTGPGVNQVQGYLIPIGAGKVPIDKIMPMRVVLGYTASDRECVDCTVRGTVVQPSFWY